jgi:hypothetical protein
MVSTSASIDNHLVPKHATYYTEHHFVNHPLNTSGESNVNHDDDGQSLFRVQLEQMRKKLQKRSDEARGIIRAPPRSPTSKPTQKLEFLSEDESLKLLKLRYDMEKEKTAQATEDNSYSRANSQMVYSMANSPAEERAAQSRVHTHNLGDWQ